MARWTDLREFDGIDLSESYVLDWQVTPGEVVFELDVALMPGHVLYATPPPDERRCWRRGQLHFPAASAVRGLPDPGSVIAATDATGARDYGCIDELTWDDGDAYVIGDFGEVTISSARPHITFHSDATRSA